MSLFTTSDKSASERAGRATAALTAALMVGVGFVAALPTGAASAASAASTGGTAGTAAAPAAVAVPAGKLAPTGCAEVSGGASCDIYAMAGTTSVLGNSIPIWGFSTTGAVGSATAPGPLLVVKEGDSVSITLHNQLAGENVSLALPGQASSAIAGTAGDDQTGVAAGSSRTYSFTASRAGTFSYEAGHTGDGSRQVAMGLAGVLVVLASDGTAYGKQYDDDAVVALSEIDPAFNADPAHFDMRNFAPKYRLINGKPFPSSDPISTDQNHVVRLRYVNVGAQTHSMSTLGVDQTQLSQDGHPMAYPERLVTETVEPGATADTLVTMPPGPEAKFALFDASEHLDNNAQTTADPQQFAYGGMLTFLDTSAPPPSTDGVGPVSKNITLSPNPSDALAPVTVKADLSDATTGGSPVSQAEFVIDDAVSTGPGFGTPMAATFGTVDVAQASGTIAVATLAALDAGKHQVFVRALDAAGNWGVIGSAILNLPKTGPQTTNGSLTALPANGESDVAISTTGDDSAAAGNITNAEYFLDSAGSNGSGTPLTLNRSAAVVSEDGTIPAATVHGLTEGMHHVLVHSKDSLGLWGPLLDLDLPVDLTGPAVDAATVRPNPSNGLISDPGNPGYLMVSGQVTDKDAGGAVQSSLQDAEAFLDPIGTPAGGTGLQLLATDGKFDSPHEDVYGLIPLSQVKSLTDGTHHVYLRGQDAAGNWGALFGANLNVDKTPPVLGALTVTPNPTAAAATLTATAPVTESSLITAAEYWFGAVDPGIGHGNSVPVSVVNGKVVVSFSLANVRSGAQQLHLRVQDQAGNWSNVTTATVTVQPPNRISANTFNSGVLTPGWIAVGRVALTPAAGLPAGATNKGLQATLPGGVKNTAAYLADSSPASETGYHAKFTFNRHTLTSGTNPANALTLFNAQTTASGQVMALQYRFVSGAAQLRAVLYRTGTTALTGNWVALPTGNHVLQLDWTAATAGSLRLSVDGVAKQTIAGNTSSLRIDTVRLGITSGVSRSATGSTAGTAYFDSFTSGRLTP